MTRRSIGAVVGSSIVLTLVWLTTPALAWHPEVEAWCTGPPAVIHYRASAWQQDELGANPQIGVYIDGERAAEGAFTWENGYEFSGTLPAPEGASSVTVLVLAETDWTGGGGDAGGQSRQVDVDLSECVGVAEESPTTTSVPEGATVPEETPTTVQSPTTEPDETEVPETTPTTVPGETATTVADLPEDTTEETVTTGPEETVAAAPSSTQVLQTHITSSAAPATAAEAQVKETLPFTGPGRSSRLGGIGLGLLGLGAIMLWVGRRRDGRRPEALEWK